MITTEAIHQKFIYWQNQLRDMSARNKLLYFKEYRTSNTLITHPSMMEIFSVIVDRGQSFSIPTPQAQNSLFGVPETEYKPKNRELYTDTKTIENLNKTIKSLQTRSRIAIEERGVNSLYLTFGMLEWFESTNGDVIKSPLILVPVVIDYDDIKQTFFITMYEDEIVINPTLYAKLERDFNLTLPEINPDISADTMGDVIQSIKALIAPSTRWQITEEVTLGMFEFHTLMIITDLNKNFSVYKNSPLGSYLCGNTEEPLRNPKNIPLANELDRVVNLKNVFQILDADSSQQEAIEAAKRGASFILEGPPGTGKSQTICNIIAECLAQSKNVLFVSQKSAALEVVKKRLDSTGLGDLCLEIHSHKRDKREIVMEIYDSLNNQTNNLNFFDDNQVQLLEESRNKINSTVTEIHKKRFSLELSLYESIGLFLAHQNSRELRFNLPNLRKITLSDFDGIIRLIENVDTYGNVINLYKQHPWYGCFLKKLTLVEREAFEDQLEELFHGVQSLNSWLPRIHEDFPNLCVLSLDDLDSFFNVLSFFRPTIFAPSQTSYVRDYSKYGKKFYRFLVPKYYRAFKQIRTTIIDGKKLDKEMVSLALTLLWDEGSVYEDAELAQINDNEIFDAINLLKFVKKELPSLISIFQTQALPYNDYKSYPLSNLLAWINSLYENFSLLDEWMDFQTIWGEGIRLGLEEFFEKAIESKLPSGEWRQTFKRRFYHLFIEEIIFENPDLQTFKGPLFSQEIHKFVTQDLMFIEKTPQKVVQISAQKKPVNSSYIKADSAETNILRREANKRRRIKPTRILFKEIPTLIQTVKPCLLMSPFTVSQLLDPELYKFDVVIFDEASQIPPEYAVASIARGNQIIVAGDRNQLPPTRFFQKFESETEDESEEDDFESVINVLDAAGFPTKRLKWHYRSKDESLIAFSNYHFYHNELVTFPNVDKEKLGIHHVYVPNGIYRRGSHRDNPIEAQQVCDILVTLLEENPEKSIGIVCFSQAQQTAILDQIEIICRQNPDLVELLSYEKEENVFVKNLETVQGDERDIIIFSVGYGKDENGKMGMNFGPLNKAGGERRLNVAVTRARERVYLVTSIEPEDIDLTRTHSHGVRLFKNYLETARDGRKAIYILVSNTNYQMLITG